MRPLALWRPCPFALLPLPPRPTRPGGCPVLGPRDAWESGMVNFDGFWEIGFSTNEVSVVLGSLDLKNNSVAGGLCQHT